MNSLVRTVGFAAFVLLFGACAETPVQPAGDPAFSTNPGATLVHCPSNETRSTSGLIGALGGVVQLDGHSVVIPAGALLEPTTISLEVPASDHLKVQFRAGSHQHFEFLEPVSLSISYARCDPASVDGLSLGIWHLDDEDNLLSYKGGTDFPLLHRVTAVSDHFSNYAVGAN